MTWTIISVIVSLLIAVFGGIFGIIKYVTNFHKDTMNEINKKFDDVNDGIGELNVILGMIQGKTHGFITAESCRLTSEKHEAKIDSKIKEVKDELKDEINAVEERLNNRIEKIEKSK